MRLKLTGLVVLACLVLPASASASSSQWTMFEAPRELLSGDQALRSGTLDEIQAFGVRSLRIILYWKSVAPSPDARTVPSFDETDPAAYSWGEYDRAIADARARGMQILLTVTGPVPRWATSGARDNVTRPSATRFERFMTAVGRHYGGQVAYWAVWNEPNHPDFLGPQYVGSGRNRRAESPKIYRGLFQAAVRGLSRAGRGNDRVLMGETAPRGTGKVVAPLTFLRGALCLDSRYRKSRGCGKLPAFGYAHHAYTTAGGPFFKPPQPNDVTIGVISRLRTALDRAGRAGAIKKGMGIYLTEFGIQSWPDRLMGVSEAQQAEYRSISEQIAYRDSRVRAFSQYLMRDDFPREGVPAIQRYSGFESGLRTHSGKQKASYDEFPLPLVAQRSGNRVALWGLVRPGRGAGEKVKVQYRINRKGSWRSLTTRTTNSRGYWSGTTSYRSNRTYRVTWTKPDGTRLVGPETRVYRRP